MLSPHGRRVLRISDCGLRIDCRLNPQFKSAIRIPKSAIRTATVGGKDYSVVAGSPPLYALITASIPDVMNIEPLRTSRVVSPTFVCIRETSSSHEDSRTDRSSSLAVCGEAWLRFRLQTVTIHVEPVHREVDPIGHERVSGVCRSRDGAVHDRPLAA